MGSLVFQATLGGQVNLNGPNTASTFDIAVPATTGTMVTTGDTGTVTNTMLAASAYNTPGTIGSGTANTGAFTTLSASSTVSGTGFSTYLASPPAIGGTAAAAGTFTTLSGTTSVTTPIVKSASSLTLQTNGTTTAVTIDTSQNVAFAKGFTVGATAAPSFSAYANANQTLTSNVSTKVILQLEEWDTASAFDNATNYRFTPTVAGYYKFDATLRWACTGAASGVWLALYKNGSLYKRSFELGSLNSMQNGQILLSEMCSLNGSTDYVELYCLVAGTSPSLDGTSGSPYSSRFSGFLARSA
jgi:hypothetical protein